MAVTAGAPILYAAEITPLAEDPLYAAAYAAATPARRDKADRFRIAADRQRSLAAELLLRHALRESGFHDFPAPPAKGENGKPFFPGSSFHYNLSHSGDWVLCAAGCCDVGCDVEQICPIDLKLARRFHPGEQAAFSALPDAEDQLDLFFRLWTLKESFMKATGLGMSLPLDAFQILPGQEVQVLQTVDTRTYRFREFPDALPGYRCALCAAGDCRDTVLQIVDLRTLPELSGIR